MKGAAKPGARGICGYILFFPSEAEPKAETLHCHTFDVLPILFRRDKIEWSCWTFRGPQLDDPVGRDRHNFRSE